MYDVIIVGAGPGGIFAGYELIKNDPNLKVLILESGNPLSKRNCPIDGNKIKSCVSCASCDIMNGFGGAGAFSDGKYNITNEFGGDLHKYIGKEEALKLMQYVDDINMKHGGSSARLFSTENSSLKRKCLANDLHLLDASVRHLGTDLNYIILENIYELLKDKLTFKFHSHVSDIKHLDNYEVYVKEEKYTCKKLIISTGRSGSKWMQKICNNLNIETKSNRVDIGVRVELPYLTFAHITDEVYESKIVYRTRKFQDLVRTFCMNPKGVVVTENTNGIITVNGHSYEDQGNFTENTNFALLVSNHFSEPFKNSNEYGESIARLSNMLGTGVLVQRFGDLIRGQRSTQARIDNSFISPSHSATPGDLSLVIPKRQLDDIIEMIYALDKIAPGCASDDTLLYGVEVKFYNLQVSVDNNLETSHKDLYVIGDCSGVTHSLSHASASGVYVARKILSK
ncbi:MAG: NAD(P)/FAD-dependent oxidoreductase [Anaerorhabdus sp.]